jgi:hypothetical protein
LHAAWHRRARAAWLALSAVVPGAVIVSNWLTHAGAAAAAASHLLDVCWWVVGQQHQQPPSQWLHQHQALLYPALQMKAAAEAQRLQ